MAQITLRILDGADRGRVFDELRTPVTIGREEGNSLQLNDERVSRFHVKIQEDQDKVVITDLESTNGTKVNGEDIQLRILRYGDIISIGRSVLLFGSREQIAEPAGRAARRRPRPRTPSAPKNNIARRGPARSISSSTGAPIPTCRARCTRCHPPELPDRLSPGQAAQLCELLEYLHIRIRDLLATVTVKTDAERVTLEARQWQNLIDLQARLAAYLRSVGQPPDDE